MFCHVVVKQAFRELSEDYIAVLLVYGEIVRAFAVMFFTLDSDRIFTIPSGSK